MIISSNIDFKTLSLFVVPILILLLITAIIIVLWPRASGRVFLLSRDIAICTRLLGSNQPKKKLIKKLYKRIKNALTLWSIITFDEFYELSSVYTEIKQSYDIIYSVRLTGDLKNWDIYKRRIYKHISKAVHLLQNINLLPNDISGYEDRLIKKRKRDIFPKI